MTKKLKAPVCDWVDVIGVLGRQGIGFRVCNGGCQVKVGEWNFYPTTGNIRSDGGRVLQEKGLEAFLRIVKRGR